MAFVVTKIALFYLVLGIHLLIRPSLQVQRDIDLPLIDPNNFRYQYFSLKKTRRSPFRSITRVQVHDEFACHQHCARMKKSCSSVNFKKEADENSLHMCEMVTRDERFRVEHDELEEDGEFYHSRMVFPYHSCAEVPSKISGVYHIFPIPLHPVPVYCDMTTTGEQWTVIQKRVDGSVDFSRNWDDYKWGFGNKFGEYWLGLENIHAMTSQRSYRLRIDLEDFEGNTRYAEYSSFLVSGEQNKYRLTIGTYSGTAGDSLTAFHNGMPFTTKDRDNDNNSGANCAVSYTGAWWYSACHLSNLNGQYLGGPGTEHGKGVNWFTWLKYEYSLKIAEMKIRPE